MLSSKQQAFCLQMIAGDSEKSVSSGVLLLSRLLALSSTDLLQQLSWSSSSGSFSSGEGAERTQS